MRFVPQFQRQEPEEGLKCVRSCQGEICVIRLIRDSDNCQKAPREVFNHQLFDYPLLVSSSHRPLDTSHCPAFRLTKYPRLV